jgi:hypothetical protein
MLTGNRAEHARLVSTLDRQSDSLGYSALLNAAFIRAVSRRFGKQIDEAAIIDFVADARSRSDEIAQAIDPRVGERLIRKVTSGESTDDINASASSTVKLLLLAALVADEHLEADALDEFLASARKLADYLIS